VTQKNWASLAEPDSYPRTDNRGHTDNCIQPLLRWFCSHTHQPCTA